MRGVRAMMQALRDLWPSPEPRKRRSFSREEPRDQTEVEERVEQGSIDDKLKEAVQANARVSMGAIVTASQAMAAESSAQAFLKGIISAVDKGQDHDGRN